MGKKLRFKPKKDQFKLMLTRDELAILHRLVSVSCSPGSLRLQVAINSLIYAVNDLAAAGNADEIFKLSEQLRLFISGLTDNGREIKCLVNNPAPGTGLELSFLSDEFSPTPPKQDIIKTIEDEL